MLKTSQTRKLKTTQNFKHFMKLLLMQMKSNALMKVTKCLTEKFTEPDKNTIKLQKQTKYYLGMIAFLTKPHVGLKRFTFVVKKVAGSA